MGDKRLAARKALLDDFSLYAKHALKIRTKEGQIDPLVLNNAQNVLYEAIEKQKREQGYVRIIVLKARQQGLSTAIGGYLYHGVSQARGKKAMVVAHKSDSTQSLFDMTKRYHENCPDVLKPHTKYSSRRELVFDVLDSSYTVATAGGDDIARGETITHLHASELAFWQASSAKRNWNGLIQSVPATPGTSVFIESTACGVSGLFYELWKGAVEGKNGYMPVFIPWFLDTGYRVEPPKGFTRTPDEKDLAEKYDLDDGQLAWRRRKVAENGLDLFRQEYPSEPEEAFLTTGRPIFNPDQLREQLQNKKLPKTLYALQGSRETGWEWEENPRGDLKVWAEPTHDDTYYIGADCAAGVRGGDWSVAQVLDSSKRLVAQYRAQVHPDYFADVLFELGVKYNTARIIPESNNHGLLLCHVLAKELAYPDLYWEVQHDKVTDKETTKVGFMTNVRTKPLLIDELRASMRERELTIEDEVSLMELQTYIMTDSGKMEAEDGCHDDCVMALALANYIHEGEIINIEPLDEYYVENL